MADEPCVCCVEPAAPGATAVEMKQQQQSAIFTTQDAYVTKYLTDPIFSKGSTVTTNDWWHTHMPVVEQATPNYVPGTIQPNNLYTQPIYQTSVTTTKPIFSYDELKPVLDEAQQWSIKTHVDSAPIYSMGEVHPTQYVASTPQVTFEWTDNWGNKDSAWCAAATVDFQKIKDDWEKMVSPGEIKSVEIADDPPSMHHHDVVKAEEETQKAVERLKKANKKRIFKKKPDGKVQ